MRKCIYLFVLLLFMFSSIPVVHAATGDGSVTDFFNQTETPEEDDSDLISDDNMTKDLNSNINQTNSPTLFSIILKLIIVLAIIIGLIYLLLRVFNRSGHLNRHGDALVNLGGISLGTNKSIQTIKIGKKVFLVGVGDDISLLTEITDEQVIEALVAKQDASTLPAQSILGQLKIFQKQAKSAELEQQEQKFENQDFASLFKGELETMKEKREKIRVKYKEED